VQCIAMLQSAIASGGGQVHLPVSHYICYSTIFSKHLGICGSSVVSTHALFLPSICLPIIPNYPMHLLTDAPASYSGPVECCGGVSAGIYPPLPNLSLDAKGCKCQQWYCCFLTSRLHL